MRIVVLGAAGRTGREVVGQAVAEGHEVVAFARSAAQVPSGVHVVTGDATRADDLAVAFRDADAVISTLGATKGPLITDSTGAILAAAAATGVKRITVLSSFGVVRDRLTGPARTMTGLAMGKIVADKTAGEELLRGSALDWTLVHATALGDGPATGAAHVVPDGDKVGLRDKITRSDVAAWLLRVTGDDAYRRRAVLVTG